MMVMVASTGQKSYAMIAYDIIGRELALFLESCHERKGSNTPIFLGEISCGRCIITLRPPALASCQQMEQDGISFSSETCYDHTYNRSVGRSPTPVELLLESDRVSLPSPTSGEQDVSVTPLTGRMVPYASELLLESNRSTCLLLLRISRHRYVLDLTQVVSQTLHVNAEEGGVITHKSHIGGSCAFLCQYASSI